MPEQELGHGPVVAEVVAGVIAVVERRIEDLVGQGLDDLEPELVGPLVVVGVLTGPLEEGLQPIEWQGDPPAPYQALSGSVGGRRRSATAAASRSAMASRPFTSATSAGSS